MNLDDKSDWHKEMNRGGQVPMLEIPDGNIYRQPNYMCKYALQRQMDNKNKYGGMQLVPNDDAINEEQKIGQTDYDYLVDEFIKNYLKKGDDPEMVTKFVKDYLPKHEAYASKYMKADPSTPMKYLAGTDDLTMADMTYAPFWEMLYMMQEAGPFDLNVWRAIDLEKNAPCMWRYINTFREHPAIKPHRMNKDISFKYW